MSEILAPAGSFESLVAAVRCSADAVYLGAENFNARGNAKNFDRETLQKAVNYCHERNVKVYLTLNTIISDDEQKEAEDLISFCGEIGIDAFIIQDLSLVEKIKRLAPAAHLHASTQMTVQSVEAINFLENLGFSRVVVPRELTREEIMKLCEKTNVELEVFVHGALCMSVSGQCYMSAMLGSRSGNRGLCAQPCRLPFSADSKGNCHLSLKDNSLVPYLKELEEMGVASFKIEGRMKRPEYVAAAVTSCRNQLNENKNENIEKALRAVFSRSGFTDGYYKNKRTAEMFGTRGKEDVTAAKDVLNDLAKLYEKETAKFSVDFSYIMKENQPLILKGKSQGIEVQTVSDCVAEKAIKREITEEDICDQLSKLGGTQFFAGQINIDIEKGLSVPLSAINRLRRDVIEKITLGILEKNTPKKIKRKEVLVENKSSESKEKINTDTYLFLKKPTQIPDNISEKTAIVLPLETDEKVFDNLLEQGIKVCAEMPRGIFTHTEKIKEKAENLFKKGIERFFCPTIDSAVIVKNIGAKVTASYGSNIFNSEALDVWKNYFADEAVLSVEMTISQIEKISSDIRKGVICYGKLPLMLIRNCPMKNVRSCSGCKKDGELTDRKGIKFSVDCSGDYVEVLNSVPLYVADQKTKFRNADFFVLKFTTETKEEVAEIYRKHKSGESYEGNFTRGLYHRGVI